MNFNKKFASKFWGFRESLIQILPQCLNVEFSEYGTFVLHENTEHNKFGHKPPLHLANLKKSWKILPKISHFSQILHLRKNSDTNP